MAIRFSVIFLFAALAPAGARAAVAGESPDALEWRFWRAADGLGESWTVQIAEDPEGRVLLNHGHVDFMSIIEPYGVRRIPSPGQWSPAPADPNGGIWAVYWNPLRDFVAGFQRYADGRWTRYPDANVESVPDRPWYGLKFVPVSPDTVLYLQNNIVYAHDADALASRRVVAAEEAGLDGADGIVASSDRCVWIWGGNGAAMLGPSSRDWRRPPNPAVHALPGERFKDLGRPIEDRPGEFVAAATLVESGSRALIRFDGREWRPFRRFAEGEPQYGWRSADGTVWFAGEGDALWRQAAGAGRAERVLDPWELSSGVTNVLARPDGMFWLTTTNGVAKWTPPLWRPHPAVGTFENAVLGIGEDGAGAVWFISGRLAAGLREGKLHELRPPDGFEFLPHVYSLPGGKRVFAVRRAELSLIELLAIDWSGGEPGLAPVGMPESPPALTALPGREEIFWLGPPHEPSPGLEVRHWRFDGERFEPFAEPPHSNRLRRVRDILPAEGGGYWICGTENLALWRDGTFTYFGEADGYKGQGARRALAMDGGAVWIGGKGIVQEYSGGVWKPVGPPDSELVYAMVKRRNGEIWVAAGRNVYRRANGAWIAHTWREGLPETTVSCLMEDSRGRLWMASGGEVRLFHPGADPDPPMALIPETPNPQFVGPYCKAEFVFEGIDKWRHTPAGRLMFSHRLDGGEWSPFANGNEAEFADLPGGTHWLEVRAMDLNGNVSPAARFEFRAIPHWWEDPAVQGIIGACLLTAAALGLYALNRHRRLAASYETLRATQSQLIQSEKMASLGQLVAGISHEINTPVGIGVTAASHMEQKNREISELYEKGAMRRSDLEEYLKTAGESCRLMMSNLMRARQLIESFKMSAADQSSEEKRRFAVRPYIEDILRSLGPQIRRTRIEVRVEGPVDLELNSYPGMIAQIVTNLVMNALAHAFEPGAEGRILIHAAADGPFCQLRVSDNGSGMEPEVRDKAFDPFFTTKRANGGTGMGLHIVYNIVTRRLRGTIRCESEPGRGATFIMRIPKET